MYISFLKIKKKRVSYCIGLEMGKTRYTERLEKTGIGINTCVISHQIGLGEGEE